MNSASVCKLSPVTMREIHGGLSLFPPFRSQDDVRFCRLEEVAAEMLEKVRIPNPSELDRLDPLPRPS